MSPKQTNNPAWRCNFIVCVITQVLHHRSTAFDQAVPCMCSEIVQFTFYGECASSTKGGFGSSFLMHCLDWCIESSINTHFWTTEQKSRRGFELLEMLCPHTLTDNVSPACCIRESKWIRAATKVYISALWVFALSALLQIYWNFKSYIKYYIRVRRKFYKFVN